MNVRRDVLFMFEVLDVIESRPGTQRGLGLICFANDLIH